MRVRSSPSVTVTSVSGWEKILGFSVRQREKSKVLGNYGAAVVESGTESQAMSLSVSTCCPLAATTEKNAEGTGQDLHDCHPGEM
jgi:hypothetical protein